MSSNIILMALLSAQSALAGVGLRRQTTTFQLPPSPSCTKSIVVVVPIDITRQLPATDCQTYSTNRIVYNSIQLWIPGDWVHICFGSTTTTSTRIETRPGVCWADAVETISTTSQILTLSAGSYGTSPVDSDTTVLVTSTTRMTTTLSMASGIAAPADTLITHLAPADSSTSIPIYPSPSADVGSSMGSGLLLSARSSATLAASPSASSTIASALDGYNNSQPATSSLSNGSIAGIVVACLIVLLVVATGSFIIGRHRKSKRGSESTDHERTENKVRELEYDCTTSTGPTPTHDFGRFDLVSPMEEDSGTCSPSELPGSPGTLAELGQK